MDFSEFFHMSSKDPTGGGVNRIPVDQNEWPDSWKTIETKTYARLPKIELPDTAPKADHFSLVRMRRSSIDFEGTTVGLEQLSTILRYSCGLFFDGETPTHRAQPSAGARYPIEVYPILLRGSDELGTGVYHYNVDTHSLDVLWKRDFSTEHKQALVPQAGFDNASCLFVMTATFDRTKRKYGERGYRYILLEAGHIGQNMLLAATALDLSCAPLGVSRDTEIEQLLDIDGVNESVVYGVVVG